MKTKVVQNIQTFRHYWLPVLGRLSDISLVVFLLTFPSAATVARSRRGDAVGRHGGARLREAGLGREEPGLDGAGVVAGLGLKQ